MIRVGEALWLTIVRRNENDPLRRGGRRWSMNSKKDAMENFDDRSRKARHDEKGIMVYHGDDFVSKGDGNTLEYFKTELSRRLLAKALGVLGWIDGDLRKVTLLNRIVKLTEIEVGGPCLQWEADQAAAAAASTATPASNIEADMRRNLAELELRV